MANFIKGNLNFAVKSVAPAQKANNVNAEPTLVVASTSGKFTLSASAGLALGLQPGDNIGFMDNLNDILAAIAAKVPAVVEVFEQNGLDINNADDVEVFVSNYRETYIHKGFALLNADGTPKMVNARTSKEEKLAMFKENEAEVLAQFAEAGIENPTEEQIIAAIPSKQEPGMFGSKLATVSDQTGMGLTLNFTDGNVWASLKRGVDVDARTTSKSIYKVDVKNPQHHTFNDGCKDIDVLIYPIVFDKVENINPRSKGESEQGSEE